MKKMMVPLFFLSFLTQLTYASSSSFLDFFQALEDMKRQSPKTLPADLELDYTKVKELESMAQFLPSFSLSAYRTSELRSADKSDVDSFYLNSSINLFKFGADLYQYKAARREKELGTTKRHLVDLEIESESFEALTDYVFQEQSLKILDDSLKIKEDYYQTAKKRAAKALVTDQEVTKIFIDLSNLKAQREDTYLLYLKAQGKVFSLLSSRELKLEWPFYKYFSDLDLKKIEQRNYDWQQSLEYSFTNYQTQVEEAKLTKSKLSFLPTVDLSFSTGYDQVKNSLFKDYDTRAVLSVTIPLFENLKDYSAYKGQVYTYYQSFSNQKQKERDLKELIHEKKLGFLSSVRSAKLRAELLLMARKLYQTSLNFFNQGRISVDTLQRDQERLLESEYSSQKAWAAAHQSYKDFCHLLGFDIKSCEKSLY